MNEHDILEQYLGQLDRALKPLSVGDRADIVIEIKSHVMDARAKDATATTRGILASLGEPEAVASRYLLERGHKPNKPSKSPAIRWLVIGFLGTISILAVTLIALVWTFTPLLEVDGKAGTVRLLGGLLTVQDDPKNGRFNFDGLDGLFGSTPSHVRAGTADAKDVRSVRVKFANGKIDFLPAKDGDIAYDCGVDRDADLTPRRDGATYEIDATAFKKVRCDVYVPRRISVDVEGTNGKIALVRPTADAAARLSNGKIDIAPAPGVDYRYDLHLSNGSMDRFTSSDKKDAIRITAHLVNGKIAIDD